MNVADELVSNHDGSPWPPREKPQGAFMRERLRRLAESLLYLGRNPFTTLFTWALIGVSVSLPSAFWLIQQNLQLGVASAEANRGITIYFKPNTALESIEQVETVVENIVGVRDLHTITAEQALQSFQDHLGFASELTSYIDNPLPASIDVELVDIDDHNTATAIQDAVADNPAVEDVIVDSEWMYRLSEMEKLVARLTWGLAVLLGIGSLMATVASLRTAVATKLPEMSVLNILGAPDSYLRRPFLYCGLLYGFGGGIIAVVIISAIISALEEPIAAFAGVFELSFYTPLFSASLIAIGIVLGLVGATYVIGFELRKNYPLP